MRRVAIKTLGLVALAAAAVAFLINPTLAADKGGPPVKVDAEGNVKAKSWTGCFADVGAAGFFADGSDTVKAFSIGAGCDYQLDTRFVVGIGGNYIIGTDDAKAIDALVRIGLLLNPNLLVYGRAGILMDGEKLDFGNSIGTIGAGIEASASSTVTIGGEVFTGIKGWGDFKDAPDNWTGRAFVRFNWK